MKKQITIVGVGMGDAGGLTAEGRKAIEEAGLLIGGERLTDTLRQSTDGLLEQKRLIGVWRPEEIRDAVTNCDEERIAVLMSGDSGFNSGTAHLIRELREYHMEEDVTWRVLPGIGAISALAAKAQIGWEEAALVSLHGKAQNLFAALATYPKVFVLSGRKTAEVMGHLKASAFNKSEVYIGERMDMSGERMVHLKEARQYVKDDHDAMTTMLIIPRSDRTVRLIGMPDDVFVRGKIPMTKSEVRAISISRMSIRKKDMIYDIGSGSGSIAVEASMQAPFGKVYAIDKNPEAADLTRQNREHFFCRNMEVIEGEAPQAFQELPAPDVAFVGGSAGRMREILSSLREKNPNVRVVINTVTPENLVAAYAALEETGFSDIESTQITAARAKRAGAIHRMEGLNPVTILSAMGGEE